MGKGVAVVSGGMDSTTLVYHLIATGTVQNPEDLRLVSFDYGQRHKKELQFAGAVAKNLSLRHDIIDLTNITHLISNSALTSQLPEYPNAVDILDGPTPIEVPEGHYAEDNMKLTVVPNRNSIMLAIATGVAVNEGADFVAAAMHAGDHFVYPDCRPEFFEAFDQAERLANEGFGSPDFELLAPFIHWTKTDIAYRALELGVPLHLTWSCYKGGENHCGRCGTCVERLEAIDTAEERARANGIIPDGLHSVDQTVYDDDEYWRVAVRSVT